MSDTPHPDAQAAAGRVAADGRAADAQASEAFDLLHEKVRRWIWRQGWTELRDIQERSIPILLQGTQDLIVAAGTASGKTEAAFLPIVSRLARNERPPGTGFEALYVSPLRALINDQFGRMETLCEEVEVPVVKWHGDVAASVKARARKRPQGILLTTPESLEAILVRRGNEAGRLFGGLGYIVVDEMHAYMDSERGRQLQSLLNRIEIAAGHRVARVGLSATLADMLSSARFLRPLDPQGVAILESQASGQELRLQLRGYIEPLVRRRADHRQRQHHRRDDGDDGHIDDDEHRRRRHGDGQHRRLERGDDRHGDDHRREHEHDDGHADGADDDVAASFALKEVERHLFQTLRGQRSLIFAGSRQRVERIAADLHRMCEKEGVPEEFFAHHGSLSRENREDAERRLKDESRPGSIVATTTLELGIDVGHIGSVAQIGPGHTVSGMRQRLGRSGRRAGQPAVMRIYVMETELGPRSSPIDALRTDTVQAIAMVNLMLRRWNEPPQPGRLHLSTLVQQILALIAQHGGLTAKQGWSRLVESGVFPEIDKALYMEVLRRMGHPDVKLIEQAPDGTLLPGEEGERVIADRSFYAVFITPDEFKIITDRGRTLGSLPIENAVMPDQRIIFAGRRWRVLEVDTQRKEILVSPAYGGNPPAFGGDGLPPADEVVAEMRRVYEGIPVPRFLDETAVRLLTEARETFDRMGLRHNSVCRHEDHLLLFPWVGTQAQMALVLALASHQVSATSSGITVAVPAEQQGALKTVLGALARSPAPDAVALARLVPEPRRAKYDGYLDEDLLARDYASERIDAARVPGMAGELVERWPEEWNAG